MSIGFKPSPPPSATYLEAVYWRLQKGQRIAEARVRTLPNVGLELRVLVDDALVWSRFYRTADDFKLLGYQSERCREDFLKLGWRDAPTS